MDVDRLEELARKHPAAELMRSALAVSVPLYIVQLRQVGADERVRIAHECAQVIAEKGDVLQFRGGTKGESARAFNALAKGLAAAAFSPGGVRFLGDRWEA
jgi:hypothetical protein